MKVLSYRAHNVMRLSDVSLDLSGHHLFLVGGKNDQGKTSALNALLMALCGRSGMDWPEVALKEGETEGWVRVELSGDEDLHDNVGFAVELLLKRKRNGQVVEQFRLVDSAGEQAPEPRTLLRSLYHYRGFDPLEFRRLGKKEQRKILMELAGVEIDAAEAEIKAAHNERTLVNRQHKAAKAELDAMQWHYDIPEQEVSVQDLLAELSASQKYNAETDKMTADCEAMTRGAERVQKNIATNKMEIERLEQENERLLETVENLHKDWWKKNQEIEKRDVRNTEQIKKRISDAGLINRRVRENAQVEKASKTVDRLRDESEKLSEKIDRIRTEQQISLQEADWPLDGLSVDSAGVLFNGIPFEQISTSQATIVSTKIGMALNPKLRLLVCQGGGDLDGDTLDSLSRLLKENDFQMVLEIVTRSKEDEDRCAVVISDGTMET